MQLKNNLKLNKQIIQNLVSGDKSLEGFIPQTNSPDITVGSTMITFPTGSFNNKNLKDQILNNKMGINPK